MKQIHGFKMFDGFASWHVLRVVHIFALVAVLVLVFANGCGGGGGKGGGAGGSSSSGFPFGERLADTVFMQPGPPPFQFPSPSGNGLGIQIDQVIQFSSVAHPASTGIFQATSQVVYGQITGPVAGEEVILYSFTNQYFIQPLTSTTVNIGTDSTWIAPANPGQITALLVRQGYQAPNVTATLPAVDGVNVLAVATQP